MPEYLSPGVYIEEFEIGAKPIEGVSTSTAGFVGFAERGPLNIPTLVTSFAEYQSIFGGYLPKSTGDLRWLAYAVEAFFNNGGQRVYVTRVAKRDTANAATGFIPDLKGDTSISLKKDVPAGAITLQISDSTGFVPNDVLYLSDGPNSEYLIYVSRTKVLILDRPLDHTITRPTTIQLMNDSGSTTISKTTVSGTKDIFVTDITQFTTPDLAAGDILIIEDSSKSESCIVQSSAKDPDPKKSGKIIVTANLSYVHNVTASVTVSIKRIIPAAQTTDTLSNVMTGSKEIPIAHTGTPLFVKDKYVKITDAYYKITDTDPQSTNHQILLRDPVKYDHPKPKPIKKLIPAISVTAVNEGVWGNEIKVIVTPSSIAATKLIEDAVQNNSYIKVNSVAGLEKGSVIQFLGMSACSIVTEVIKSENKVILNVPLILNTPSQKVEKDTVVSSVEFDLSVHYQNLDENFKYLSLNPDHSRYIKKIIKDSASQLIKIDVLSTPPDTQPMPTLDKDPGWRLNGGLDGIDIPSSGIDAIVMGEDDDEPFNRTGIYTLRNINEISLVAIPGITTQAVQNSLITHCELMKNRFAVLDPIPIKDLKGIQEQRNLYDSKYAALYYPWIQVYDPLSQGPINAPPSGIICGIYARSDNERGVHKAPANEKINGALGLEKLDGTTRIITKGQQDILNPKGINCIRSFPGRGIRVWGARTISSDKLWKYVNVRRLFIYVEESIRENTQWVVFEPNNEKLWGRLKATITEFLTRVWMDGALMGTKPEEAFFVKCDRTTMSQSDIDNGRLICVIGIAPTKPAEFVIFRIAQWQGGSAVTE